MFKQFLVTFSSAVLWIGCSHAAEPMKQKMEPKSAPKIEEPVAQKPNQKVDIDAISETFGNFLGKTLVKADQGITLNVDKVILGIKNGAQGKAPPLNEEEYQKAMALLREKAYEEQSAKNLTEADNFLKGQKNDPEMVEVMKDKLYYKNLKNGTGEVVTENSTPKINYKGTFVDGTVFGSSEQTGPISVPLQNTIPGLRKGIVGMKVGGKRQVLIHSDLADGMQGELPPNKLLIFEIEILEANTASEADMDSDDISPDSEEDLFE